MGEYIPERYPGWRYHASGEKKLVHNEQDDEALGPMWFDSPVKAAAAADRGTPLPDAAAAPPRRKRGRPRRQHPPVAVDEVGA